MAKENISKMKREPVWENMFAKSDEDLISKIYKELTRFLIRKRNNPIKKWAKGLNRHCSKEGPETYEMMLRSLAIREMQIKTTMRYYFTPVRVAIINKSTTNKCW